MAGSRPAWGTPAGHPHPVTHPASGLGTEWVRLCPVTTLPASDTAPGCSEGRAGVLAPKLGAWWGGESPMGAVTTGLGRSREELAMAPRCWGTPSAGGQVLGAGRRGVCSGARAASSERGAPRTACCVTRCHLCPSLSLRPGWHPRPAQPRVPLQHPGGLRRRGPLRTRQQLALPATVPVLCRLSPRGSTWPSPLRRLRLAPGERVAGKPWHATATPRASARPPDGGARGIAPRGLAGPSPHPHRGAVTRGSPAPTPWGSRGHPRGCHGPHATAIPRPFPGRWWGGGGGVSRSSARSPRSAPVSPAGSPRSAKGPGAGARGARRLPGPSPSRGRGGAAGREPGRGGARRRRGSAHRRQRQRREVAAAPRTGRAPGPPPPPPSRRRHPMEPPPLPAA